MERFEDGAVVEETREFLDDVFDSFEESHRFLNELNVLYAAVHEGANSELSELDSALTAKEFIDKLGELRDDEELDAPAAIGVLTAMCAAVYLVRKHGLT